MRFAEYSGHDFDEVRGELKAGTRADRLALVTRTPRAGVDEETWGTVWRKDWTFDLHEFRPDGTFATQKLHYPTNRRGEIAKQGEIAEGTWEYDAALMTMPKGGVPAQHFVNTGFKAMGWTFPAVCLSSVVCVLGFVLSGPTRPVKPLPLP